MKKLSALIISILLLNSHITFAAEVNIAVAGNFYKPLKVLAKNFEQLTGDTANIAVGSSGKLYAQITMGAPFEIFISADQKRVAELASEALAIDGSQFTYAKGKLVLWSNDPNLIVHQGKGLSSSQLKHLAIANPKLAPYGEQAITALKNIGVYSLLKDKLVLGQNVGQAFQFITSGSVNQGIIAMSQVTRNGEIKEGSAWIIPSEYYQAIKQDAILLNKGANNPVAHAFLNYLKTEKAQTIIRSFGYEVDI